VRWSDIEAELLDQARQAWGLAPGQIEDQAGERGRVDDRMLERALEAAADEPGVERVMAVLDQHRALREAKESAPRVLELRRADQHRTVDVMALASVWVDGRPAVDQGVEEGERVVEREALGTDLENEKRRVAGRLHVECDELGVRECRLPRDLRRIDRDLLPGDGLCRAAGLEVESPWRHHRAMARARRAHAISAPVTARRTRTATA
jgi:hypothetical protein